MQSICVIPGYILGGQTAIKDLTGAIKELDNNFASMFNILRDSDTRERYEKSWLFGYSC